MCPVCKAGIDENKVSNRDGGCWGTTPAGLLFFNDYYTYSLLLYGQVIPIYGRGACSTDPRTKDTKDTESEADAVPRRPAGQRPVPVQRHPVVPGQPAMSGQQGLGFVPTLFGLQPGPGMGGISVGSNSSTQ